MNLEEVLTEILNKQLEPHNLTVEDVRNVDEWYQKYTRTQQEEDEWMRWGVDLLRERLRWAKWQAEREMRWINLMWGLKVEKGDNKILQEDPQEEAA